MHAAMFGCDTATYYKKANDELLVVLMAEHVDAIENAEEIMSVPGIDCVFIGPNDLTNSMRLSPVFECGDKCFTDAVEHIIKTARKHNIAPGIHVADWQAAARRREEGFQFIAVSSENRLHAQQSNRIRPQTRPRRRPPGAREVLKSRARRSALRRVGRSIRRIADAFARASQLLSLEPLPPIHSVF
jgi:2-keto-3-deoxy-L-rhamnonate aldolase RhmA